MKPLSEVQRAEALVTAHEWAEDAEDAGRLATMARALLAAEAEVGDLRGSVARLEREMDEWMRLHAMECKKRNAAEAALASARVEGAREALWKLHNVGHLGKTSVWFEGEMTRDDLRAYIKQHYPTAAPVPETRPAATPSPVERVTPEPMTACKWCGDVVSERQLRASNWVCDECLHIVRSCVRVSLAAQDGGTP